MTKATGTFAVASWDEDTYEELDDGKLTRAVVTQTFAGDIEGDGSVQWLMAYRADGTAHFVGLQLVSGAFGDRKGSVVLETVGDFDGKVAKGAWTVVQGSGTGDLVGVTGTGGFEAPMGGGEPTWTLDLAS
jgi:hypothetical protein